jgi:hypothetical protein
MTENIRLAASACSAVAESLERRGHGAAGELRAIAQQLLDGSAGGGSITGATDMGDHMMASSVPYSFDPSSDVQVGVKQFRSDKGPDGGQGAPQGGSAGGGQGGHPQIETFVRGHDQAPMDTRKIHQLSCTLKAPEGVSESDMMNYILQIGDALGVDVDSFKWSKSEPKGQGGA